MIDKLKNIDPSTHSLNVWYKFLKYRATKNINAWSIELLEIYNKSL